MHIYLYNYEVYDFIPLKQGLKRAKWCRMHGRNAVYDFIPLKQGLKHIDVPNACAAESVYDFIPLKQGLKLFETTVGNPARIGL